MDWMDWIVILVDETAATRYSALPVIPHLISVLIEAELPDSSESVGVARLSLRTGRALSILPQALIGTTANGQKRALGRTTQIPAYQDQPFWRFPPLPWSSK